MVVLDGGRAEVLLGDCQQVMAAMEPESVDAIVTDPPYGLEFMGKGWDRFSPSNARIRPANERDRERGIEQDGLTARLRNKPEAYVSGSAFQSWCEEWAIECLRVLKPGGHLLAFGGTRTSHRMVCAIEDAGFEIRDSIHWIYAQGFPKSHNLSGEWQGYGTALKPAHEPIVVARKPLIGTVASNVLTHGTGALNIDGCRVGLEGAENHATPARSGLGKNGIYGKSTIAEVPANDVLPRYNLSGRWPANIVFTHSLDCEEDCAPDCPVAELDRQSGERKAGGIVRGTESSRTGQNGIYGHFERVANQPHADSGGASRFFPVFRYEAKASRKDRGDDNSHPTVKPTALMQWLVRLITPPGGVVLDPFAGSGSTLIVALQEGFKAIGIEQDPAYVDLIHKRLAGVTLPLPLDEEAS